METRKNFEPCEGGSKSVFVFRKNGFLLFRSALVATLLFVFSIGILGIAAVMCYQEIQDASFLGSFMFPAVLGLAIGFAVMLLAGLVTYIAARKIEFECLGRVVVRRISFFGLESKKTVDVETVNLFRKLRSQRKQIHVSVMINGQNRVIATEDTCVKILDFVEWLKVNVGAKVVKLPEKSSSEIMMEL